MQSRARCVWDKCVTPLNGGKTQCWRDLPVGLICIRARRRWIGHCRILPESPPPIRSDTVCPQLRTPAHRPEQEHCTATLDDIFLPFQINYNHLKWSGWSRWIQNGSKEIYELINKYRICKHKKCQFGFLAKRYILLLILRQCDRVIERAHGEPPMRESWTEKGCLHVKLRTALTSISTWGMMLGSRGSRAGWIAHGRGGQRFSINSRRAVLHLEIEAFVENMKSERRQTRFIPHYCARNPSGLDFIISLYIHLFKSISHWTNCP